jgi:hypothetical protein
MGVREVLFLANEEGRIEEDDEYLFYPDTGERMKWDGWEW